MDPEDGSALCSLARLYLMNDDLDQCQYTCMTLLRSVTPLPVHLHDLAQVYMNPSPVHLNDEKKGESDSGQRIVASCAALVSCIFVNCNKVCGAVICT